MLPFKLLDAVTLTKALPAEGLAAGAIGTIVYVHADPGGVYEVEFCDGDGATLAIPTLAGADLKVHQPAAKAVSAQTA